MLINEDHGYQYCDTARVDILRMIPPDGQVIGTIGCGYAATEALLVRDGRIVHGVDTSEQAILRARERLSTARVVAPDEARPFPIASLDGLILADVIEHMPAAWSRLSAMSESVRPGGWVVISVPNMRSLETLFQLVVKGDWPEAPLGIFDATHIQVMTHKRLVRWALASGLDLERWFDCYDYRFVRRNIYRALDIATGRLARSFLNFEIQGRFRRRQ